MSDGFTQEYVDEWRELARPLEELTGIKHWAFDPDVAFHYGKKSVSVPRWLLELINEGLAKLEERDAFDPFADVRPAYRRMLRKLRAENDPDALILTNFLADADALLAVVRYIDPGALMMAADELPLEAVPRSAHLRRIVKALAALPERLMEEKKDA